MQCSDINGLKQRGWRCLHLLKYSWNFPHYYSGLVIVIQKLRGTLIEYGTLLSRPDAQPSDQQSGRLFKDSFSSSPGLQFHEYNRRWYTLYVGPRHQLKLDMLIWSNSYVSGHPRQKVPWIWGIAMYSNLCSSLPITCCINSWWRWRITSLLNKEPQVRGKCCFILPRQPNGVMALKKTRSEIHRHWLSFEDLTKMICITRELRKHIRTIDVCTTIKLAPIT